jgi:hypothetical protein
VTRLSPRRLVRLSAAAALLFAAAGCMTVDGDLRVNADDTVSGEFVVAIERRALVASGRTESEFLTQLDEWNPVAQLPAGGRAESQPYIADHLLGKKYVYDRVPLTDFGAGGSWGIQHTGARYVVTGSIDFTDLVKAVPPGQAGAGRQRAASPGPEDWDVVIRITFPGQIRSTNGQVSGRTVSWEPQVGRITTLAAEADDGTSPFALSRLGLGDVSITGQGRWALAGLVTVEVAVTTLSAVLLWRRRRRRALALGLAGAGAVVAGAAVAGAAAAGAGAADRRARRRRQVGRGEEEPAWRVAARERTPGGSGRHRAT